MHWHGLPEFLAACADSGCLGAWDRAGRRGGCRFAPRRSRSTLPMGFRPSRPPFIRLCAVICDLRSWFAADWSFGNVGSGRVWVQIWLALFSPGITGGRHGPQAFADRRGFELSWTRSVGTDGTFYQTDVFAASYSPASPVFSSSSNASLPHGHGSDHQRTPTARGGRIESVNPVHYKTITIVDEPPTWPGADDDDMASRMATATATSPVYHAPRMRCRAPPSTFSHTHAHRGSNSTTHSTSTTSTSSGARSLEVDTDEDPVAPITPLPSSRFDLSGGPAPAANAAKGKGKTAGDAYAELEGDDSRRGGNRRLDRPRQPGLPLPVVVAPPPPKSKGKGKSKKTARAERALSVLGVGRG
ncbi:hypothetical protein C8F04DRAFT_1398718 [Mycena alexandri]|uniref:Uncharacterized protein n=1 Tax=Mycena alexandri TaxID=1745969 RepID=A0AAD6SIT8_9AGAR|nr:hypothetical protein C8F04DRAFT_1398718 [Mycena alexandri]